MITTLSIILVFGLMVMVHELGHFLVAKRSGIKILEFAFGIGPKVFGIKGKETLYSIRIFPLGGFVRFLSAEEIEDDDDDVISRQELLSRSFESKSIWKKMSVIVAGPLMNFILGAVLFIMVFAWFGVPVASSDNIIGSTMENKPASLAGLAAGDRILAVNGITTPDWTAVTEQIHSRPGEKVSFKIEKAQTKQVVTMDITPEYDPQSGRGLIGITPNVVNQKVSVLKSAQYGLQQTVQFTQMIVTYIVQMITGKIPVELSGPVAVAQVIGEGARQGLSNLLSLTGILSIQFGILNLLPIPALDGGQLAVLSYEGIRRKPINAEKKGWIQLTGFVLLMALMIAVTYKDIVNLLTK
ncbi:MAG: putative zinc metalloprotease [Candidatus Dichloromethanomonas elyunquensis]|nr:MAG: putative zinc metalloprotease [Candidatus Dichloromethanomonas elyunquensis]